MSALSDAAGICPHQLGGLLCRLRETIVQDKDGKQHKVTLPCKVEMGQKCPFGKGDNP